MMIKVVPGELLNCNDEYIVMLNDCVHTEPKGFALDVCDAFPWADPYGERDVMNGHRDLATADTKSKPGSIKVYGDDREQRYVVAFFGLYSRGRPYSGDNRRKRWKDGPEEREAWFKSCLDELAKLRPYSIGFPYKIGCRYSGGNWTKYEDLLQAFADSNPKCRINMYVLPSD